MIALGLKDFGRAGGWGGTCAQIERSVAGRGRNAKSSVDERNVERWKKERRKTVA